jgi:hypothetical protein
MKKSRKNENGMALAMVLVVTVILSLIGLATSGISTQNLRMVKKSINDKQAHYAAEAGLNHAMSELRKNTEWNGYSGNSLTFKDHKILQSSNPYTVWICNRFTDGNASIPQEIIDTLGQEEIDKFLKDGTAYILAEGKVEGYSTARVGVFLKATFSEVEVPEEQPSTSYISTIIESGGTAGTAGAPGTSTTGTSGSSSIINQSNSNTQIGTVSSSGGSATLDQTQDVSQTNYASIGGFTYPSSSTTSYPTIIDQSNTNTQTGTVSADGGSATLDQTQDVSQTNYASIGGFTYPSLSTTSYPTIINQSNTNTQIGTVSSSGGSATLNQTQDVSQGNYANTGSVSVTSTSPASTTTTSPTSQTTTTVTPDPTITTKTEIILDGFKPVSKQTFETIRK